MKKSERGKKHEMLYIRSDRYGPTNGMAPLPLQFPSSIIYHLSSIIPTQSFTLLFLLSFIISSLFSLLFFISSLRTKHHGLLRRRKGTQRPYSGFAQRSCRAMSSSRSLPLPGSLALCFFHLEQSNYQSLFYLLKENAFPPQPFRSRLPFPNR